MKPSFKYPVNIWNILFEEKSLSIWAKKFIIKNERKDENIKYLIKGDEDIINYIRASLDFDKNLYNMIIDNYEKERIADLAEKHELPIE